LEYSVQISLFCTVVFTALVTNALAPDRKPKLRRVVLFAAAHFTFFVLAHLLMRAGLAKWTFRANLAADLFSAFAFLTAGVLLVVDVLLPRLGARLSSLTSDLAIGVGYIITLVSVLRGAGLNPTEAVATGAVVSAVLALSLQSTLGNILGGVALQLDGSISVGDWIQLENGRQGRVTKIRWRHTVLETRDFDSMIVPNATLLASSILVLGKRGDEDAPHRMHVQFHVDHRYAPAHVVDVVSEALQAAPIDNVAESPAPNVICAELAHEQRTSFALYTARYHIHNVALDEPTSSVIRARIYAALKRAKIPLAMPATAV
jgi:small-conductance mechanosensitive channel